MAFKALAVVGASLLLAGCVPEPRPAPASPTVAPVPGAEQPPAGANLYTIDSQQSEIRLLVYRAGPMARLGHNHVIVNRAVTGWATAPGVLSGVSFSLVIPVADFVIDDGAARAAEGPDFAEEVSEDAKAGTRHNMLSAALLDADRYQAVRVASIAVMPSPNGSAASHAATVAVTVAGHESRLTVPFSMETSASAISATGSAVLRQSDLGLVPFSVMMGALKVQDELTVKFRLVARKG